MSASTQQQTQHRTTEQPTNIIQLSTGLNPFASAFAAGLFFSTSHVAVAATIDVTSSCNLRNAILAANTDASVNGCPAGSGADTIILPINQVGILTSSLTEVTSVITIEGNGSTRTRSSTAAPFRIFTVRSGGNLTINNMMISGGMTSEAPFPEGGGGILNGGILTLNGCTVSDNSSTVSGGGGGILNRGSLTLNNSTVSGNRSSDRGGGIYSSSITSIFNSTLSGNTASSNGGALYVGSGSTSITNSTLSGNSTSSRGGALYVRSGSASITSSTITGNTANAIGGVASNTLRPNKGGYLTSVNKSIISGNSGTDIASISRARDAFRSMGNNLIGNGRSAYLFYSNGDQIDVLDPLLGPLADNGGPTQTHAPLPGSAAVDTVVGDCTTAFDQRGFTRPVDGDGNGTATCDKGAVEGAFERSTVADVSIDISTSVDTVNQGSTFGYVLSIANGGPEAAQGTVVTDSLAGTELVGASSSIGTCSLAGDIYTCNLGTVPSGAAATINLAVRADQSGVISNTASVRTDSIDPVIANNIDTETTEAISPTASVSDVSLSEGGIGLRNVTFTVQLSFPAPGSASGVVGLDYATADGTATAGEDYVATAGMFAFAQGQSSGSITVPINGDFNFEADETFFLNLSAPRNILLPNSQAQGTILNDDSSAPAFSINDASGAEGDSGTRDLEFTVTLSRAATDTVQVNYATANFTAASGSDYSTRIGTVTFNSGQTSKKVRIPVIGDTVFESDESFQVNLSAPTGGTVVADGQGQGTILNDDPLPSGISVPATSFDFGARAVGSTSGRRELTISSVGQAPLVINSIQVSGDYVGVSDCPIAPATLPVGSSCTLSGSFRPTATGVRPGSVTINSNAPSSPTVVQLTGTGF